MNISGINKTMTSKRSKSRVTLETPHMKSVRQFKPFHAAGASAKYSKKTPIAESLLTIRLMWAMLWIRFNMRLTGKPSNPTICSDPSGSDFLYWADDARFGTSAHKAHDLGSKNRHVVMQRAVLTRARNLHTHLTPSIRSGWKLRG